MAFLTNLYCAFSTEEENKCFSSTQTSHIRSIYFFGIILTLSLCFFSMNTLVFLDDAFIYLRVAKNIANGTEPLLNPGDTHFPVTSPLWVFVLAFLFKLLGFIDMVLLSKIISMILLSIAAFLAFLLLRRYIGIWAILSPLPIFFNYITVTTLGGEIPLVYLALFGTLWAYYDRHNYWLTGLFTAMAYLARAELIFLLPVLALHYLMTWKREKRTFRVMLTDWAKISIMFLSILSIWHIYYAIHFHSVFPNTLNTKIIQGKSGLWELYYRMSRPLSLEMIGGKFYLVFFLCFGLAYFRAISLSILLYTVFHYYAYKFLTIPYYHWYFYDFFILIPMFTLFGIVAFFLFLEKYLRLSLSQVKTHPWFDSVTRIASFVLILTLSGICILTTTKINYLSEFKKDPRLGCYTDLSTGIKSKVKKGDILLSTEIGIMGYQLEDAVIRDVNGIASPDVTVENINNLDYFISAYCPRFIFFPMTQRRPERYFTVQNGKLALYRLEYPSLSLCLPINCIFSHRATIPAPTEIGRLEELKKNTRFPQDSALIKLNGYFALAIRPPYTTSLSVPSGASALSISFGFLPESLCNPQELCQKSTFSIYGVSGQSKTLLYQKKLMPFDVKADRDDHSVSVSFSPGQFTALELRVNDEYTPPFPCAYWGNPQFR
ncbi:MAG: hypothetical protein ACM3SY_16715 [Candidatus Omnitrophota bacterium]